MGCYFEPFSIIFFTFKTEQMIIREFVTEVNMKFDKFIFSCRRRHEIKASNAKHRIIRNIKKFFIYVFFKSNLLRLLKQWLLKL